jgi:hypothetical protein
LVRVIEHMSGRQWLEDRSGRVVAVLTEGYQKLKRSSSSTALNKPLKRLLEDLDRIAKKHEEVADTDVRERMSAALRMKFLGPKRRGRFPQQFGMFSAQGNARVRQALLSFTEAANAVATKAKLTTPRSRLDAFQNIKVKSRSGSTYDEYFGHCDTL